jgi:Icc-related predicted phosphoesterase
MKIMICGDWHGNTQAAVRKIYTAKENGCDRIYQVGDFGLWPGKGGSDYLRKLNTHLQGMNISLYWLDGNHEWHDKIDRYLKKAAGNWPVRTDWDSIWYMPRGYRWEIDGRKFLACGGAVSVDKEWRVESEREANSKRHILWWPQEQITEIQASEVAAGGECDVMLTHDCPADVIHDWMMVPNSNYKMINESHTHRVRLQGIIDSVRPKWVIHGHLHYPYHKLVNMKHGVVHVVGLNMESDPDSHIFFDTDKMEVVHGITPQG